MSLSLHGHINSFIPAASKTLLMSSVLVANYLCAFKNYLACNVFNSHDLMSRCRINYVLPGCTDNLLHLDLNVNKVYKDILKAQF
jgi:hypothetical protein